MKSKLLIAIVLLTTSIGQNKGQTKKQSMNEMWGNQELTHKTKNTQRGKLFNEGNYAMFIHFGIFSELANEWKGKTYYGIGEWIMSGSMANIPYKEYMETAKTFNPVNFNAKAIVQLAKDAGMKYIVITSKHHDGFAMFQTKVSKFNIVEASPFGRDPMKELSLACKEAGMGFGFYYSHNQDWTEPGGNGGPDTNEAGETKTFKDYFYNKCLPQVEEITSNYGPIELVWFDTPGAMPAEYAKKLVETVHKNQPNALVSGRVGSNLGDYASLGDMEVPIQNVEGMWESVDVTNDAWGYAKYDQNWKSPKEILMRLISTVARGGTYMLNIGPKGDGTVPEMPAKALVSAGNWIKRYPQTIYSAEASPWKHALPWGDVTMKNNKLSLIIYNWPVSGHLYLPGLKSEIQSANILQNGKSKTIQYTLKNNWIDFQLPTQAPEQLISVVELTLKDTAKVDITPGVDPSIPTILRSDFATVEQCKKTAFQWMEKFGEWKHVMQISQWTSESKSKWDVDVMQAGIYQTELTYAGSGRMVWNIETEEGESVKNQQNAASIITTFPIGWIRFNKSGRHTLTVSIKEGNFEKAKLSAIKLTPVVF